MCIFIAYGRFVDIKIEPFTFASVYFNTHFNTIKKYKDEKNKVLFYVLTHGFHGFGGDFMQQ